jgi:predicted 2-oxoglutarate/Fe(II)-dependent dioxygenase YbiX
VTYLNDDMEGGELQVTNDKIPVEVGRAIIFPSFTNHKVMQFYNKNRYVLVCFAEGNTFK